MGKESSEAVQARVAHWRKQKRSEGRQRIDTWVDPAFLRWLDWASDQLGLRSRGEAIEALVGMVGWSDGPGENAPDGIVQAYEKLTQ